METIRDFLTKFKKEEKKPFFCSIYSEEWMKFYNDSEPQKHKKLCNEFLEESGGIADLFNVGIVHLFLLKDNYKDFNLEEKIRTNREIRIEFLEWLIYVKGYVYFSEI